MATFPAAAVSPAYQTPPIDQELYNAIAQAERVLKDEHVLAPRSGYAFTVPAGHIFRISTPEGPQVGDLNLWNQHDARERFWAARTRQLHASHVSVGDRLWSTLPNLRPMVTIIADTLKDYGVDEVGARCHDLLGTRCDPYVNKLFTNDDYDYQCHSNLTRAVLPYGLTEYDIHDVLNVFQVTGLDEQGRYFMRASPAQSGTYIEFFAEMDLLCALSTCPGGDLSTWGWGEGQAEGAGMKEVCRPLKVEIFELQDSNVLRGWSPPVRPSYRGLHGMKIPTGEGQQAS